ncbi:MAG: ABC transporter ATP-binding protein [Chiayiivirga sp.]|jgi:ABC-2 type transport system ATP-binding protein|uniref:ABC transporter ATP-binding protein n=1 Tax=Chiayiivirga sp. TaxID=2041042 RepID=UPI0025B7EF44|nr:ABC transporter ATP-binding protein [Chiayiivirga sp.]MCI1728942.1 ABC transporter ATP-binding protein [Chiayiivirga sp.]
MTPALALTGVSKHYDTFALHDINLRLPAGQVMGLVGVNGAGKSTLLRLLMGLIKADRGEVEVFGQGLPEAQVTVKRDIGYASDDMRLYRGQTLRWHMDFVRSIYPGWDESYAAELCRRFDLRPEQTLGGFSHGQRVKALLLLIFARHPRLLLLDEPTTGLDPVARLEVLESLAEVLRDEQRSVLFSSHNTADIEQVADSITFLHQGRILASQDKDAFLDRWRRVLCQGPWSEAIAALPGVVSARHSAPMIELKVDQYGEALLPRLQGLGFSVTSVEPMSLEDIFVTTVRGGAVQ